MQPSGSKFCNQCGTALDGADSTAGTPRPIAPEPSAVRKQVTALFGDLVGSTSFGEQVDPEAVRTTMAGYFELLRSTIEDHAGTVAKFMGDGVMAVFGIPEVAEDDALRAVAAGVELQQRFRSFAESVRERHGIELGLRVGVNTGELVIGDDDADMVGDVLNTAARLEAACHPGRVLVGEDTWRLTRSAVTYEVLGEVRVKGKADAIATFQVVDQAMAGNDEPTPFVGRRHELAELQLVFTEACDTGAARLATVIGAPGVGKTRLAAELRAACEARSFDLRFERRGSTTFTPIAELLRELTGSGSAEDIARLVGDHREAARLAGALGSLLGHGEARSTEESFWAVRRLFEMLTVDGPMIVVVDDIQWAEPLFWDLLDHLVEWTTAPLLIVALARPELRQLKPELAQPGRRVAAAIALEGLDAATTRELAARLLDTDELPADLIERLPASTEGNPLFVRELVQMLVDDGVLARVGDRWRLTIDVDAIEVPPTILSLLASRVERLPDDERQVVELASVIGTEFDRGTLGAIAGPDVASRLGALIDRLRRKDLVEPSGAWAGDHPVYRFHHVLIRDAAYRRLLKGRRADLHERVGQYFETAAATDELDVVIAHHYEQVHRYRSELGTVDDATRALASVAVSRLRSAAELALAREDLPSSGGYALRALTLVVGDAGTERDELLSLGCEALLSSGDVARGAPLVDELHERSTDERLAAWADCFRAQLWSLTDPGRLVEATEVADAAADQLAVLDDNAGVAKARLVRASCLARLGRVGECEEELDLALGAARAAGDRRRTVAVLGAAPLAALWGPSPVARAGGRCLDVLRLLRITTASPAVEATSIRCQGMLEALRGRFDSAREKLDVSRTTARDLGLRQGLLETELFAGFVELLAGDPVAAEPHLRAAQEGLGRQGIAADAGQAGALLARSLLLQGRVDEADPLAAGALESAGQNLQTAMASRSALAEIRAAQGRHDEARRLIDEAIEIAEHTDVVLDHALTLLAASRIAGARGDRAAERSSVDGANTLLSAKGVTASLHDVASGERLQPAAGRDPGEGRVPARPLPIAEGFSSTADGWKVIERSVTAWRDADEAVWRSCYADDFAGAGRERLSAHRSDVGIDEWTTAAFDLRRQGTDVRVTIDLVAERQDELFLSRTSGTIDGFHVEFLIVARVTDGLIRSETLFDADQLAEALAELDRRYLLSQGFAPDHWLSRYWQAVYGLDRELLAMVLHPSWEYVEHRRLTFPDSDAAGYYELLATRLHDTGLTIPCIHRLSGEGIVYEWAEEAVGEIASWSGIVVSRFLDESVRSTHVYEIDDLDTALARYDGFNSSARTGDDPPTLTNAVTVLLTELRGPIESGDHDGARAILHPDAEIEFRMRLTGGVRLSRDEWIDNLAMIGSQRLETSTHVLAVRGSNLALVSARFDSEMTVSERCAVIEGGDGVLTAVISFDGDQFDEATAELDRRWVELGGSAVFVDSMAQVSRALANGEREAIRACITDDFVAIDHRQLGLGQRRADEWTESMAALGQGTQLIVTDVVIHDGHTFLNRSQMRRPQDGAEWNFVHVASIEGGLVSRIEVFAPGQIDEARALYEQLAATADAETTATRQVTNPAWETVQLAMQAGLDGGRLLAEPLFDDSFTSTSHERFDTGVTLDRAGYFDVWSEILADADGVTADHQIVAVRDDSLCLYRLAARFDGDEVARLGVAHVESGRIVSFTWYEADDLHRALDALDRQWLASGGPTAFVEVCGASRRAFGVAGFDLDALPFSDDFVTIDHRLVGLGRRDLSDFLKSSDLLTPSDLVHPQIFDHHGDVWFYEFEVIRRDDDFVWHALHVAILRGNQVIEVHVFALEQFNQALAVYEQLTAVGTGVASSTGPTLTNRAWVCAQAYTHALVAGDRRRFVEVMTPDFLSIAGYRLNVGQRLGPEQFADSVFAQRSLGAYRQEIELVATRGDDLCLVHTRLFVDENLMEYLIVVRSDGDRLTRIVMYDETQFQDAIDELDRQWAEHGGPARVIEHTGALRRAIHEGDAGAAGAVLSPAFQAADHRRLGLPILDRDEYLAAPKGRAGTQLLVVDVARHTEDVTLERIQVTLEDGWSTMEMWAVISLDAHGIVTMDNYDIDDAEAARARFDELTTPTTTNATTATTAAIVVSNHASQVFDRCCQAAVEGGTEAHLSHFHADFEFEARRASAHHHVGGLQEWGEAARFWFDEAEVSRVDNDTIATRGERFALGRVTMVSGVGDEWGFVYVAEVDDGTIRHLVSFDDAQLDDALDELDRQHAASAGLGADHLLVGFRADMRSLDIERIRPWLHPEFRFRDHRDLAWPELDGDGWVEHVMGSIPSDMSMVVHRILITTADGSVEHGSITSADGSVTIPSTLIVLFRDERLIRAEMFDPGDDEAALARFHELTSTTSTGRPGIANSASQAWAAAGDAWRNGSISAMRPFMHPGFRFEARRASIPTFGGDRDDWLSALSIFETEGLDDLAREVIAVRGDRLALFEFIITTSTLDELGLLIVGESGDDGTVTRATTFDTYQLAEALDELDRQWVELGGPVLAATRTRQVARTLSSGPHDEFSSLFVAGFEVVDHRPLGLGTRNRDEFITSIEVLVGRLNAWTAKVFEADDRGSLTWVEMRSTESDMAWSLLLITIYDGDLVGRWEQFSVDDLPAALDRYHELVASDGPGGGLNPSGKR